MGVDCIGRRARGWLRLSEDAIALLLLLYVSAGLLSAAPRTSGLELGLGFGSMLETPVAFRFARYDASGFWDLTLVTYGVLGVAATILAPVRCAVLRFSERSYASDVLVGAFTASTLVQVTCESPWIHAMAMAVFQVSLIATMPVLDGLMKGRGLFDGAWRAVVFVVAVYLLGGWTGLLVAPAGRGVVAFVALTVVVAHRVAVTRDVGKGTAHAAPARTVPAHAAFPLPMAPYDRSRVVGLFLASFIALSCAAYAFAAACSDVILQTFVMRAPWLEGDYLVPRLVVIVALGCASVRFLLLDVLDARGEGACGWMRGGWTRNACAARCVGASAALALAFLVLRLAPARFLAGMAPMLVVAVVVGALACLRNMGLVLEERRARGLSLALPALLSAGGLLAPGLVTWRLSDASPTQAFGTFALVSLCALLCVQQLGTRLACVRAASAELERELEAYGLAPRERSVARGLLSGLRLGEVAKQMGIATSSAGTYEARACAKLGVSTGGELIALLEPAYVDRPVGVLGRLFNDGILHSNDGVCPDLVRAIWRKAICLSALAFVVIGATLRGGYIELASRGLFLRPNPLASEAHTAAVCLAWGSVFVAAALVFATVWRLSRSAEVSVARVALLALAALALGSAMWRLVEQAGMLVCQGASFAPYVVSGSVGIVALAAGAHAASTLARLRSLTADAVEELLMERFGLTRAESRIALMLVQGHSVAEIACEQVVSPQTVATHRKRVYAKMGVHNRGELNRAVARAFDY